MRARRQVPNGVADDIAIVDRDTEPLLTRQKEIGRRLGAQNERVEQRNFDGFAPPYIPGSPSDGRMSRRDGTTKRSSSFRPPANGPATTSIRWR